MLTVHSTINIAGQTVPQIIPVVQGDTGRTVEFAIADFTIPAGATATYYVQKPSGAAVYNNATIDGNTVLIELTAQSIAEAGDNFGQVRISADGEIVTSFDFILLVKDFRGIDATESTTEMNIFDQAVEQAETEITAAKNDAIEEITDAGSEIIADEFDSSSTYAAGDYVIYNAKMYCFTASHSGAWTGTDATETKVGTELTDLKNDLEQIPSGTYENMTVGNAEQLVSSQYVEDEVPYLFRTTGGSADVGNRAYIDAIVGGSVAWNQLMPVSQVSSVSDRNGVAWTNNEDGTWTANGTASANSSITIIPWANSNAFKENHKYLVKLGYTDSGMASYRTELISRNSNSENAVYVDLFSDTIVNSVKNGTVLYCELRVFSGVTATNFKFTPQIFDLTQMFGSTIADYVYGLESGTAGAGVSKLKSWGFFTDDYYAFSNPTMTHVSGLTSHDTVGFNQWDEQYEVGQFNPSTGVPQTASNAIRSKNLIPILPNTTYYLYMGATGASLRIFYLDSNGDFISTISPSANHTFTTPENVHFMKFHTSTGYGATYNNDICINLSWSGYRNGEYEAYVKHSYPLDSSVVLRGNLMLDASNELYYYGDTYEPDGTVTSKYAILEAQTASSGDTITLTGCDTSATDIVTTVGHLDDVGTLDGTTLTLSTDISNVDIVYPLATETTETADAYTTPQIVDDFGTEEYVTTGIIPVGHETRYPANLRDKLQHLPDLADSDGYYMINQTDKQMSLELFRIPKAPTTDGTYTLQASVSSGTPTYTWVSTS